MGAVEEGGKVATEVVAGLGTQPLALALVVVNVLFLAAGVWFLHELSGARNADRVQQSDLLKQLTTYALQCGRVSP